MQLGNTTAKITSQHGLFYHYLIDTFGMDFAKSYLDANEEAIKNIKEIIDIEKIDCDFEIQDSYVYTTLEEEVASIKNEVESVNLLGFPAELIDNVSLPFSVLKAIKFPNQAQFNPLKYCKGLCNCITNRHGKIYENTKVYDVVKNEDFYEVQTKDCVVKAKYVVLASHYPIINAPRILFFENVPRNFLSYWFYYKF